jgi:hypothetical protein
VLSALHEQAAIPVADPQAFGVVRSAIQTAFSLPKVKDFLKSIERAGLRIRDFELVLRKGALGPSVADEYGRLGHGDQGQIREFYLASLEQVSPELRTQFFKLYSYY